MIANPFSYSAPETIEEAASLLANFDGDAMVIGGGTMLVPAMTRGESKPELLVDLRRIGLKQISLETADIVIEARVSYDDVLSSALIAKEAPLVVHMASGVTGGRSITGQEHSSGRHVLPIRHPTYPYAWLHSGRKSDLSALRVSATSRWQSFSLADF